MKNLIGDTQGEGLAKTVRGSAGDAMREGIMGRAALVVLVGVAMDAAGLDVRGQGKSAKRRGH